MKLPILTGVGSVAVIGIGIAMALTNPNQRNYEVYAQEQLANYLKTDVCSQASGSFGGFLQSQCTAIVDSARPQIQQLITQTTDSQNFVFFSIYRTNLAITSALPGYEFETVGIFSNFYTYQARQY